MKTHRITPSRRGETFFGPIQKNRGRHVLKPTIAMLAILIGRLKKKEKKSPQL